MVAGTVSVRAILVGVLGVFAPDRCFRSDRNGGRGRGLRGSALRSGLRCLGVLVLAGLLNLDGLLQLAILTPALLFGFASTALLRLGRSRDNRRGRNGRSDDRG